MMKAACHCTAVRFEIMELPDWVLDCNCTLCRRYGAVWAYPKPDQVKLVAGADSMHTYSWLDRVLAFHRCKECGCLTHVTALDKHPRQLFAVNVRMIPTLDPASKRLVQVNNSHSGFFWTRSGEPPLPSQHPRMDPPGPDDWR